jgi:5-methylthioadenosine/S-adenosylhomocysteine deaminase
MFPPDRRRAMAIASVAAIHAPLRATFAPVRRIFRGGHVISGASGHDLVAGDLVVSNGVVESIEPPGSAREGEVVDVRGRWILPSFTQTHVHLVQTLFRGLADDLPLLPWLRTRIWPLERAHDDDSVYWSARLGITELLLGGTTAFLDMATVRYTEAVFGAAKQAGVRATIGKAMMDADDDSGLGEPTERALRTSADLADKWHGRGRIRYAFAPRFVPSCSEALLRETVALARARGALLHTHASENLHEVALVRELVGTDNVRYLDSIGFTGPDVVLAHCIHLTEDERAILARTRTTVAHCPSSNLKLGSGICPVPELLAAGARVTIGADGAPCNNQLDAFAEMRLAALVQSQRLGPGALPAPVVLDLMTRAGARALGHAGGRIEPGAPADLVIVDPDDPAALGGGDPAGAIVYAMTPRAVKDVLVDGEWLVRDGEVLGWDLEETIAGARKAMARVAARAFP